MVEQGIDERVLFVACRRMHHQSRRLVEHQQGVVLVYDVQRHRFRLGFGGAGFRPVDCHLFPGPRRMRRLDGEAVDADVTMLNQPLNRAARDGRELAPQEGVEPLRRKRVFNRQNFSAGRHGRKFEGRESKREVQGSIWKSGMPDFLSSEFKPLLTGPLTSTAMVRPAWLCARSSR